MKHEFAGQEIIPLVDKISVVSQPPTGTRGISRPLNRSSLGILSSLSDYNMSIYPQAQGYGMPYQQMPPHNYMHAAPPAPYGYPHPPQAQFPPHFPDPSSFRREYTARLSELTVNSRPIIQNLSMMAQTNTRFADIVAECLQAHIRRVSHQFFTHCHNKPRISVNKASRECT